jgi:hypothetical protein
MVACECECVCACVHVWLAGVARVHVIGVCACVRVCLGGYVCMWIVWLSYMGHATWWQDPEVIARLIATGRDCLDSAMEKVRGL